MNKHFEYLMYVLRHKWNVLKAGIQLGVPLRRLILHDWSKFTHDEWSVYVRKFYDDDADIGDEEWSRALLHHYRRNDHHPEHWVLFDEPVKMPRTCAQEMLADWRAMADDWPGVMQWYYTHDINHPLHPETRQWIESQLDINNG